MIVTKPNFNNVEYDGRFRECVYEIASTLIKSPLVENSLKNVDNLYKQVQMELILNQDIISQYCKIYDVQMAYKDSDGKRYEINKELSDILYSHFSGHNYFLSELTRTAQEWNMGY